MVHRCFDGLTPSSSDDSDSSLRICRDTLSSSYLPRPPRSCKLPIRQSIRTASAIAIAANFPSSAVLIAQHYRATYGINVSGSEVFVTTVSWAGFLLAFLASFDRGHRVAFVTPAILPLGTSFRRLALSPSWLLPVGGSCQYPPYVDLLTGLTEIKGLIAARPSNPAGSMIEPNVLTAPYHWFEDR